MKAIWCGFKSVLAADIEKYLQYKRVLKRKFKTEEGALRLLDRYLVEQNVVVVTAITAQTIEDFLISRPRNRPRSYNHLLGVIRCFFEWLVVQDRLVNSPVRVRPRRTTGQQQPFLFNPAMAKQLLALAAALPDRPKGPNRGATYYLIFAMLYTLGLRVSEVTRLCHKDVDLERQLLVIRKTKFAKDRLTPFGPRLGRQLADYLAQKEPHSDGLDLDAPFFSLMLAIRFTHAPSHRPFTILFYSTASQFPQEFLHQHYIVCVTPLR